jgi:hypothetical protein
MGHVAVNQFDRGYQRLEDGKLAEHFEAKLLHKMEIMHGNIIPSTSIPSHDAPSKSLLNSFA